jgi:hypothetical protein
VSSREAALDPATVVAICATIIALASLVLTIVQVRATHDHNRKSVLPVLQMGTSFGVGEPAGLALTNVGLGPARIVSSSVRVGSQDFGEFSKESIDKVRATLKQRPRASTFRNGAYLAADCRVALLYVDNYDPDEHAELRHLLHDELEIEFVYESIYGHEGFVVRHPQRNDHSAADDGGEGGR